MYPTSTPGVTAKVVSRTSSDGSGLPFSVVVASGNGGEHVDVTRPVVAAVAHSLWQARGGADSANWSDAEAIVRQLLGAQAQPAPPPTRNVNIPPPSEARPGPLPATPQPTRRPQPSVRR